MVSVDKKRSSIREIKHSKISKRRKLSKELIFSCNSSCLAMHMYLRDKFFLDYNNYGAYFYSISQGRNMKFSESREPASIEKASSYKSWTS